MSVGQSGVPVGAAALGNRVQRSHSGSIILPRESILRWVGHVTADLVTPEVADHAVSGG